MGVTFGGAATKMLRTPIYFSDNVCEAISEKLVCTT